MAKPIVSLSRAPLASRERPVDARGPVARAAPAVLTRRGSIARWGFGAAINGDLHRTPVDARSSFKRLALSQLASRDGAVARRAAARAGRGALRSWRA